MKTIREHCAFINHLPISKKEKDKRIKEFFNLLENRNFTPFEDEELEDNNYEKKRRYY